MTGDLTKPPPEIVDGICDNEHSVVYSKLVSNAIGLRAGISQFGWRYLTRLIIWRFPEWLLRYENAYLMAADSLKVGPHATEGIEFRLADPDDADNFGTVRISADNVRQRLGLGDKCAIALRNGEIISMLWAATGELYLHEAGTLIDTGEKAFYRYNSFTIPEERQKGLYSACSRVLYEYYSALGRTHMYGAISVFNLPSQLASQKVGNKIVGESVLFACLGLKFLFFKNWPYKTRRFKVFIGRPTFDARVI